MKKVRKKHHQLRKIVFSLLAALLCATISASAFFGIKGFRMYQAAIAEKPLDERIEEVRNTENFITYDELPQFYIQATISVEDHEFENHCGIDLAAIGRAALTDIKTRSFAQGGSTITQQLAKNLLFTQEKKLERKVAEVFAVLEIESQYTKEEIFALYTNIAYFGSGYYGIYQASKGYFGKEPLELNNYEAAMLAGLPNAPAVYSLDVNKDLASQRVNQVLNSMVRNEIITQKEADAIQQSDSSDAS